jgi:nucleoid-associated protein EbfC
MSDSGEPPVPSGLGDFGGLLESAQAALSAQAQAAEQVVTGTAGGGVVSVEMTGGGEVRSVTLSPSVVDPDDIEMLQDLIVAALHDAAHQVTELQRQALGGLGDLLGGMPGMPEGPGSGESP